MEPKTVENRSRIFAHATEAVVTLNVGAAVNNVKVGAAVENDATVGAAVAEKQICIAALNSATLYINGAFRYNKNPCEFCNYRKKERTNVVQDPTLTGLGVAIRLISVTVSSPALAHQMFPLWSIATNMG